MLLMRPPTGWKTGNYNLRVSAALLAWADQDGTGVATDSSADFDLPNGATRSPNAAAEIYGWFTEGFDTKDLQEAKALLEEEVGCFHLPLGVRPAKKHLRF
jgi:hypothetical protein